MVLQLLVPPGIQVFNNSAARAIGCCIVTIFHVPYFWTQHSCARVKDHAQQPRAGAKYHRSGGSGSAALWVDARGLKYTKIEPDLLRWVSIRRCCRNLKVALSRSRL